MIAFSISLHFPHGRYNHLPCNPVSRKSTTAIATAPGTSPAAAREPTASAGTARGPAFGSSHGPFRSFYRLLQGMADFFEIAA